MSKSVDKVAGGKLLPKISKDYVCESTEVYIRLSKHIENDILNLQSQG